MHTYMFARYVQFQFPIERVKAQSKTNRQQTVYLQTILYAKILYIYINLKSRKQKWDGVEERNCFFTFIDKPSLYIFLTEIKCTKKTQ